jgi:hypothetical protein
MILSQPPPVSSPICCAHEWENQIHPTGAQQMGEGWEGEDGRARLGRRGVERRIQTGVHTA